ncbi:MAG: 23S rRNA pseudouridine(2604) synthase RluF [Bacteroidia bacterium]|nr:23S rRNA pseudouridine(2604) synthase RluF [Bacteroidia bacterium]
MQTDNKDSISLNKYIADTGRCSRREADVLIKAGKVTINGVVARAGNRVQKGDEVQIESQPLQSKAKPVYLAFHKPVGITCTGDKNVRDNIIDFINYPQRIFYVGRLDKMSEGLILMTNDGDIVNKILRASNQHEKEYIVTVNQTITKEFIKALRAGVPILDTVTKRCFVQKMDNYRFRIILTQGLNRQIRRMCEYLGYHVNRLRRVRVMHISLGKLPVGKWRHLTQQEVKQMHQMIKDSSADPEVVQK